MEDPLIIEFGPFSIDERERMLRRDGQAVPLTPKAVEVLLALVERPGRLITKEELVQRVWPDTFVEEANLAYNIFTIRKALGDTADNSEYVETIPKRGYRFKAPVRRLNGDRGSRRPFLQVALVAGARNDSILPNAPWDSEEVLSPPLAGNMLLPQPRHHPVPTHSSSLRLRVWLGSGHDSSLPGRI